MSVYPGIQFGAGILFATPVSGQLATNPTPQEVGVIQDISFTISGDIKELFGQFQWPVDSAVGKRTIKGTFNFASITNSFLNQAFFADTVVAGIIETAYREPHTIPAVSGPYTITLVPPGSGTFVADLGVFNLSTGLEFTLVASGPVAGQYSVNTSTGVYTFAAADASSAISISYTYTAVAVGTTLTAANHVMGWGPILNVTIPFLYQGAKFAFNFPNVRLGKIDIKSKLDDYTMMSSEFSAFAGAAGNPFNSYNVG